MIDPELLLQGYRLGVFPMAMEDESIQWFSPDPRAILPLKDFHVPHALRRVVRKKAFETTIDNAFSKVIEECAKREDTWINLEIIESYTRLHELGSAHSVEAWKEGDARWWALRRSGRWRFFWRINVPPRHGCIEDRAAGAGRTFARPKIRVA